MAVHKLAGFLLYEDDEIRGCYRTLNEAQIAAHPLFSKASNKGDFRIRTANSEIIPGGGVTTIRKWYYDWSIGQWVEGE
jgi:hypothetical protein